MVPKSRRLPSRLGSRRGQVNPWPPRVPWAGPDSRASGQTESRFSVVQETFDKIPYFIRDRSFLSLIYGYTKLKEILPPSFSEIKVKLKKFGALQNLIQKFLAASILSLNSVELMLRLIWLLLWQQRTPRRASGRTKYGERLATEMRRIWTNFSCTWIWNIGPGSPGAPMSPSLP